MKLSLTDMVINILKENEKKKFTSKQLSTIICEKYKNELKSKRENPRFETDEDFRIQIQAEIGSHKNFIKKKKNIIIEEQTRPKIYFYDTEYNVENEDIINVPEEKIPNISELEMYSILSEYLALELNILSKRIDEKKSKNSRGPNGNIWLHPDLVGIEILDKNWENIISDCVKGSGSNRTKIYSFEVKKSITPSKLREYFFQSVSNSSWANSGYLVAAEIKGESFEELKMLSSLHGIGFILLDIQNPSESQILLQAKEKIQVDWESVNRLLKENKDFYDFVQALKVYYESGVINRKDWDFNEKK